MVPIFLSLCWAKEDIETIWPSDHLPFAPLNSMIRHESPSSWNFKSEDVLESQDAELEKSFCGHVSKTSSLWRTIPLKTPPPPPTPSIVWSLRYLILIIYYYVLPKIRFTSKLLVLFQKDWSIIGSRSKILPLWRGEMVASSTYFNGIVRHMLHHKDEVFETWP